MKLRKINQITKNQLRIKTASAEFKRMKGPLEYFLNPDVGNKNLNELNQHYISDEETEVALKNILLEPMDSISVLVGYQGIGKSTDIRHSYQIMNEVPKYDSQRNTIIFPSFFKGFVLGGELQNRSTNLSDIRLELSKKISVICEDLEEEFPDLMEEFTSELGKDRFLKFIKLTNPKALMNILSVMHEDRDKKISNAYINEYFIYIVTKLKYYLLNSKCKYNRILVILDDIEALPDELYQKQVISQYMRFYTCLRNLPQDEIEKEIYVNILISIRPVTYKLLQETKALPLNSFTREIYKTQSVDLKKYFNKKYMKLPEEIRNQDEWKEAYSILAYLSDKFDKKYANMIKRLAFLDMRKVLKIYYSILENDTWTLRKLNLNEGESGKKIEYIFNNITVIRALACKNSVVYYNEKKGLIPNIFNDTTDKDNMLLCLYIIIYFVQKQQGDWEYGESAVSVSKIISDFQDVLGEKIINKCKVLETVKYLCETGLLSTGIFDEATNLSENSLVCLTSKGIEIWSMLSSDSVLMELYREDYYQEYDENNGKDNEYKFLSSKDLMDCNKQVYIFHLIYQILLELCYIERSKIELAISNGSYGKYLSLFGDESLVEHLMVGLDKSIEYSGNIENSMIVADSNLLKRLINEMKELYKVQ